MTLQTVKSVVSRVFQWSTEDVVEFFKSEDSDLRQYSFVAETNLVTGYQLLGADETHLKLLLNSSARHAHEIFQKIKSIRQGEIASYPRLSAQVSAKIDVCKRTNSMILNEMKLSRFPDVVCDMIHITNLSFTGNQIRTLPPEIGLMTRLTSLKGGRNRLIALPESFGYLKSLQTVLLEDNELSMLPESIMNCCVLKILDISQNKIEMLPLGLYRCSSLSKLNLYDNPLALPKSVTDRGAKAVLQILEALHGAHQSSVMNLQNFYLNSIPKLMLVPSLTILNLDRNFLKRLNGLHILVNLRAFTFAMNLVERIPVDFCMLRNLEVLKAEQNPITFPPPCVFELESKPILAYLKAHRCILMERARDLFHAFDEDGSGAISKNEFIASLYKVDLKLSQREILSFLSESDKDGNGTISFMELKEYLASYAASATRDGAMFINSLDLSNLGLSQYQLVLEDPDSIDSLLLYNNRLKSLPDNLSLFKALSALDLDSNEIFEIPHPVGCLSALRKLSLRDNLIDLIPAWLCTSVLALGLEELYLDNNSLTSVPCDMVSFVALRQLGLKGNPLANPLRKILEVGSDFVMSYLKLFYESKLSGVLDLRGMNLEYVPEEADFRPILTCLLSRNVLMELPWNLSTASRMVLLDFSDNRIEKVIR